MHVVATAGHVDHGKSTLVRLLTGNDPDRLAEEKRRGLTIELGYSWTNLEPVGDVAFVDVPGHERFITTMLSGVGPVPVVMLVVAADDPWMPQAEEHLAACHALGITHGLIVISRADRADPRPALAAARARVEMTSLAGAEAVVVSGRTGEGLDDLRASLVSLLATMPIPNPNAPVRLWVDRQFQVRGTGTVVTGTLPAGTITAATQLEVRGQRLRIRGIEALGTSRDAVSGTARVALDLGGHAPKVRRGDALVEAGSHVSVDCLDARLIGVDKLPRRPVLHIGSAHVGTHARVFGHGLVRLVLDQPLPLRYADRALLRDPGTRRVWGVEVLDPAPPRRPRDLAHHDGTAAAELGLRGVVRRTLLVRLGVPHEPVPEGTLEVGDWIVPPPMVADLRARLIALTDRSLTPREAAASLGLPDPAIVSALVEHPLVFENGRISRFEALPDGIIQTVLKLREGITGFAPIAPSRVDEYGIDDDQLALLHRAGMLLHLDRRIVLPPDADDRAVEILSELPQPFTTSAARQALATSRRVAVCLLDHLDRTGRTVRLHDDRRRLRSSL